MEAVGSSAAVILGIADGGPVAAGFAATYPDRTRALVLSATTPCGRQRPGYPWGPTVEMAEAWADVVERDWGTGVMAQAFPDGGGQVREGFGRREWAAGTARAAGTRVVCGLESA